MKKKFLLSLFSSTFILMPFSIVSCSKTNSNNNQENIKNKRLETILDEIKLNNKNDHFYFQNDIKIKPFYNPYLNEPNLNIEDLEYMNTNINKLNLFTLLLNDFSYNEEPEEHLNSIFGIDRKDFNNETLIFDFSYFFPDSFGSFAKPYVAASKDMIIVPVRVILLEKGIEVASKYVDAFYLNIQNIIVNNAKEQESEYDFNGLNGKTLIFDDKNNKRKFKFMDIPNQVIDPYINLNFVCKYYDYRSPVIYNKDRENDWKGKTFEEAKTIKKSFLTPKNLIVDSNERYIYSINSSEFSQENWYYPRFKIDFSYDNQNGFFNEKWAQKYKISLTKTYSYIDYQYKFNEPTSSEIQRAKDDNSNIGKDYLTKNIENSSFTCNPIINFSPEFLKENGITSIVKWANNDKQLIQIPKSFVYYLNEYEKRAISFEFIKASISEINESIISIKMNLIVGEKDVAGKSEFTKEFDTKTWKFK